MKKHSTLIILTANVIVFVLQFVYLPWDKDTQEFPMFPFDDQLMSKGAYVNCLCIYFSFLLVFVTSGLLLDIPKLYLKFIGAVWLGFLLDFMLTYNQPFRFYYAHGFPVPMSYSLYAFPLLVGMVGYEFYKFIRAW